MSTLSEALQTQKQRGLLQSPSHGHSPNLLAPVVSQTTSPTLTISLQNTTPSSAVWAYITGLDINRNNAVFLLQSDGRTGYYPQSPPNTLTPLAQDCHIPLGGPGSSTTVTIPQLAGGRIWFCRDAKLTFLLNPGPGLVEPSATNPSDPNYALAWSFAEFTYNRTQLFANITYVDFVSLPISLALQPQSGATQTVRGIPASGLDTICANLSAQTARDGVAGWNALIIPSGSGGNLRALSPNSAITMTPSLFAGYYTPYVSSVWGKYTSPATPLTVDTQAQWGVLKATVNPETNKLTFPALGTEASFPQPSTKDIFSCSTGAFSPYPSNTEAMGNITARLAAAFNRSTLLINPSQPDGEDPATYYDNNTADGITNHYSRIVHAANPDGRGYAFPYDDVAPEEKMNVAGTVADGAPVGFAVAVGGGVARVGVSSSSTSAAAAAAGVAAGGGGDGVGVVGEKGSRAGKIWRGLIRVGGVYTSRAVGGTRGMVRYLGRRGKRVEKV
ncbi:glycoside hydrolase family 64 protein [Cercophora scortea]|uniref:Glycoside hydrolase family 64 protein n=1 Tax=Cercophora scortea TaxID=314031 RepID=A0AAE0MI91_9PEZI|nr:glycoside hydrolase family 64 protein [Cercophora scortea]